MPNELPARRPLGFFPTPLHDLPRLTARLGGPRLLIKRDDLTGLAFGGNKTRKLEFLLGEALAQGCDTVITAGAAQSNHCRQTAAAAACCGLPCHIVLGGRAPERTRGNLLLDRLLGAHLEWAGEHRKGETLPEEAERLRRLGRKPYVIPYGGSNPVGATGFVDAMRELHAQLEAGNETATHVVFASSSGGTHAGLVVGRRLLSLRCRLVGIAIDKEEDGSGLAESIRLLAEGTAAHLGHATHFAPMDVDLRRDYLGGGYGVVDDREREAIRLLAENEGILLDPVYTGRAFAGLVDMIRRGELSADDRVVFWHTGGTPALFTHEDDLLA